MTECSKPDKMIRQHGPQAAYTIKHYSVDNKLVLEEYYPTLRDLFIKKVINLKDQVIREELIKLGWTPPKE